jgi:hypothetical protein
MSVNDPRPTPGANRPAGVEGDGLEPYPTYHDSPAPSRGATGTKPTDVNLPRSRRTYSLPILIGLIVFALVIIVRIVWGSFNAGTTADEAMTPGDPAAPAAVTAPATAETPSAPTETPEDSGNLGENEQPQTQTGPGEVEAGPGAIDVPGGATTEPVQPAPAQ